LKKIQKAQIGILGKMQGETGLKQWINTQKIRQMIRITPTLFDDLKEAHQLGTESYQLR
jgi:hypothetical protein